MGATNAFIDCKKGGRGGDDNEVEAEGGDTYAKSGNAYGGDGGDAKAYGGDGDASNNAVVKQHNYVQDDGCGCDSKNHKFDGKRNQHDESSVKNDSDIDQGDNTATGGDATANGGNGGNADTGNTQKFNGNAGVLDLGGIRF